MNRKIILAVAASLLTVVSASGADPVCSRTCLDTVSSLHWKTVTSSSMPVALDWPAGAVKAVVTGGAAAVQTEDVSARTVDVAFAIPSAADEEKIVELAVVYYGENDTVLGTSSAKLALVTGTVPGEAVVVKDPSAAVWGRSPSSKTVLPVPAGTVSLSVDGVAVTPDIAARGWHMADISAEGTFLSLTVGEADPVEVTVASARGMIILVL